MISFFQDKAAILQRFRDAEAELWRVKCEEEDESPQVLIAQLRVEALNALDRLIKKGDATFLHKVVQKLEIRQIRPIDWIAGCVYKERCQQEDLASRLDRVVYHPGSPKPNNGFGRFN